MLELLSLEFFLSMLLYAIIGILGVLAKELYDQVKQEENVSWKQINKKSIIIGGLLTAITMPTLETYLINKIHGQAFLLIGFLMGILSMELFSNISTLSKLKNAYKEVKEVKDMFTKLKVQQDSNEKKDDGEGGK